MKNIGFILFVTIVFPRLSLAQTGPFKELFPPTPYFFYEPYSYWIPNYNVAACGDVNKDGKNDFVMTGGDYWQMSDTYIGIYYGDCRSGLSENYDTIRVPGIYHATALELVDFNYDSNIDILICGNEQIAYLQGDGTGHFAAPVLSLLTSGIAAERYHMAVGNFNGDSILDIYINAQEYYSLTQGGNNASLLYYGNTNGTFINSQLMFQAFNESCEALDVNNDSYTDIVLNNGSCYLNNAGIINTVAVPVFVGQGYEKPMFLLNSDSDVNTEYYSFEGSNLLYGEVDPVNPQNVSLISLPDTIVSLTVNDFDRDGFKDDVCLVLLNDTLRLLLNTNGSFSLQATPLLNTYANFIVSGDVNNDGNPDIFTSGDKKLIKNISHSIFVKSNEIPVTGAVKDLATGDFDQDGFDDIAMCTNLPYRVYIFYGDTCGIREIKEFPAQPLCNEIAAGKLNNDNFPDLVVSNATYDSIHVFLNDGTGALLPEQTYAVGHNQQQIVLKDFNEDGYDDVFLLSNISPAGRFNICTANSGGNGLLNPASSLQVSAQGGFNVFTADPEAADFNHDGHLDISVSHDNALGNVMTIIYGDGQGNFPNNLITSESHGTGSNYCAPIHLNQDGFVDMISSNSVAGNLTYFFCRDSSTNVWSNCQPSFSNISFSSLTVGDFNNDSIADFVGNGMSTSFGVARLHLLKPDYSILSLQSFQALTNKSVNADVNSDNKQDLILHKNNSFSIYRNELPDNPVIFYQNDTLFINAQQKSPLSTGPSGYEWYLNLSLVNGQTQNFLPHPTPGIYHAGVSYSNGSYVTGKYEVLPVGIENNGEPGEVRIYPNPSHDLVQISAQFPIYDIEIFSISGASVLKKTGITSPLGITLDLSGYSPGLYLVTIHSSKLIVHRKLMKL